MTQYIFVYIIIAASLIYIGYKIWQAVSHKPKSGCTGYCANCPLADELRRKAQRQGMKGKASDSCCNRSKLSKCNKETASQTDKQ